MNNIDLTKEFKKIEKRIESNRRQGRDVTLLLRTKARLLFACYNKISENIENGTIKPLAQVLAKELAFLNNIKQIQISINDNTDEVNAEIQKVHSLMKEIGLYWLIENQPELKK